LYKEISLVFNPGLLVERNYLVVDDFGDMRSMIKNMLMACGIKEIATANNGAQAIQRLEQSHYDVVLCDYNLGPGKDGQQVLEEAKYRQLIGLGCVFIMITAENTRDMVMGAVEYEPDSYLTKPFSKDLLKTRLEKIITKKQDLLPVDEAEAKDDHKLAVRILDEKIAQKPANSNELKKIKGEICLSADMINQARQVYEEVISVRDLPWARLGLGKTLFQEKAYLEAQALFQDLTEQHPNYTAAYDWLAKCYKSQNQLIEAQQTLQAAVEVSPKAVLRQQMLADVALLNKDDQAAEAALTKAVKHGRHSVYKNPSNYANLAKVSAKTKSGDAGLKVLREMKREFHNEPKADLYIATAQSVIHEGMGNQQAAKESLERAAEIYRDLDEDTSTDCTIELAKTYKTMDMQDKSVELLKKVILNNHTNDNLVDEIKQTMTSMEIEEDALGSIDAMREEVASLNKKGVELARNGKLTEAISLLKQTSERMPANKVVNLNTALVLLMDMERDNFSVSNADEINVYLERVSKTDPSNPTLKKLLDRLNSMIKTAAQKG
jgi:CheY-like chemotaxis protein/lipopolysaccharide biosynthesis regulator YciM